MNDKKPRSIESFTSEKMKGFPLSEAVRVGDMLYLSGQVGIDDSQSLVPGGVAAETRQTLKNIRAILEQNGSSLDRVIKVTVLLAKIDDWAEMNEAYLPYFSGHLPARTAFGVNGLALGAQVEIECVAVAKMGSGL